MGGPPSSSERVVASLSPMDHSANSTGHCDSLSIDVSAVDQWRLDWSGLNNRWRAIGGIFPKGAPVTAVARNPDHLDLFITGNDGIVYTSWWHEGGDWSGRNNRWAQIGG
jgi:hypothetical protein